MVPYKRQDLALGVGEAGNRSEQGNMTNAQPSRLAVIEAPPSRPLAPSPDDSPGRDPRSFTNRLGGTFLRRAARIVPHKHNSTALVC